MATDELVFHLFAGLAQFEHNLVRERARASLAFEVVPVFRTGG